MTDKNRQFNYNIDMPMYANSYRACSANEGASCEMPRARGNFSCVDSFPLAQVYAPMQDWEDILECQTGFERGTIFSKLEFPFTAYCKF